MRMIHSVVKREKPPSKRPRIRSSFPLLTIIFAELANKSWPVMCRKMYLITLICFLLIKEQREYVLFHNRVSWKRPIRSMFPFLPMVESANRPWSVMIKNNML